MMTFSKNSLANVESFLEENRFSYQRGHSIKYETYFKTGGEVDLYVLPRTGEELVQICQYLIKQEVEYKIIGATSNIVLLDEIKYSIIISTKLITQLDVAEGSIVVGGGYSLQDFVRVAAMNSSAGFEGLEGIPGTIGGAIYMNAGAYGYAISDNLLSVDYISEEGELLTLEKGQCDFGYRSSIFFGTERVIVSAKFALRPGKRQEIYRNIEKYHIARHSYQEFSYPNLGSMISIRRNIYSEIFKIKNLYYFCYLIMKILLRNPAVKFVRRKSPSNHELNLLLERLYRQSGVSGISVYRPSRKGANIMMNDGSCSPEECYRYLFAIHNLLGRRYKIENEFVIGPGVSKDLASERRVDYLTSLLSEHGVCFPNRLQKVGSPSH